MSRKRKKYSQFTQSALLNTLTYQMWCDRLTDLALARFTWGNIPDTIDPRFLELTLLESGHCLWYLDDVVGRFLALPAVLSGEWDVYNTPLYRTARASNGYFWNGDINNSVIIYNNYLRTPAFPTIELYAYRLAELERTIDTNVKAQKTPVLLQGTESQRLSLINLYMQYDGNQPFIFGNKDNALDGVTVINTGAPLVAPQLTILKHQYFNEYLSYLGIENSNEDKKERLVANEVGSNYGNVEMSRRTALQSRQDAAEKINKMFGLDISVEFNSNLSTLVNAAFQGLPMSIPDDSRYIDDYNRDEKEGDAVE